MKLEQVKGLFAIAGIKVLATKALCDGYGYQPDDDRFLKEPMRTVWWFVKTPSGWVEIGWRKRVISINWSDTPIRKIVTEDDVTKGEDYAHAWEMGDALKYLTFLAQNTGINFKDGIRPQAPRKSI